MRSSSEVLRSALAAAKEGDLLIAISTSDKSKNVQRALDQVKAGQLKTIALLGRDGGPSGGITDVDLIVAGTNIDLIGCRDFDRTDLGRA